jgi:hypothetical protein
MLTYVWGLILDIQPSLKKTSQCLIKIKDNDITRFKVEAQLGKGMNIGD